MLETLVTLWHKGLKFEHTLYTDAWLQPDRGNHAEISHMLVPKSRHIENIVTYIIYINEKKQNNKP